MNDNQHATTKSREYYVDILLSKLQRINQEAKQPAVDIQLVQKAIDQLQAYHNYLQEETHQQIGTHAIQRAILVSSYCYTTESIVAALLYDMAQKQCINQAQVAQKFGKSIADQLTKLVNLHINTYTQVGMQQVEQLMEDGEQAILTILLLDNLSTLESIKLQSQPEHVVTALKSLQTFAPLAAYLRLYKVEAQLVARCKMVILPALQNMSSTDADMILGMAGLKP